MNRQTFKRITPKPIWAIISNSYWWWYNRGRHRWAQVSQGQWAANKERLAAYQDSIQGGRCFIIGNGPSLNKMDLSPLKNEITFGLNRIYLAFPKLGFATTYLVSTNDLVLEQCAAEMSATPSTRFVTWRARRWFAGDANTLFLDTDFTGPENFSGNLTGRLFEGFTVTYTALQIAFSMGFSQAILIGVDHNFTTQGLANATVVSLGDDPNHFAPNYFGKGFRWQLPDLEGSERAYRLAQEAYTRAGREVLDATVDGKLTIFPKVDYRTLFD
ncbi:MAG TPA: 6-hydroxymethylpterin diphosphokinase MptE-like protein [Anaerolineaceae bacterium]|nr:6-hydroxymethylpterin diphosphokinase MptE-like protein [Anaerolineaceae bacterium]